MIDHQLGNHISIFIAKRHNDVREWGGGWEEGWGWGAITNDVLKFRKFIEFQSSRIAMN